MYKLVKESLGFERKKDPHRAMGIGSRVRIEQWLEEMRVTNWIINTDWTIDVESSVSLTYYDLEIFPDFIQFGNIKGDFECDRNLLESLKGCPITVGGDFKCNWNKLISLEYMPTYIGGDFYHGHNNRRFTRHEIEKLSKINGHIYG